LKVGGMPSIVGDENCLLCSRKEEDPNEALFLGVWIELELQFWKSKVFSMGIKSKMLN